jgi:cardiolipin synthase
MFSRTTKSKSHAGSYSSNNSARVVKGGSAYFDLLEKMIDAARHIIHLQFYIFDEDDTGRRIARSLIEAAVRGVKIFVMVDGYASQNLSRDFVDNLKRVGINFRRFEPILKSRNFYFGRRMHHKIVVTDNFHGLIAGLNLSDRYNDTPTEIAWLDWAFYVEGETAETLARICIRRYKARIQVRASSLDTTSLNLPEVFHKCSIRVRINDWVNGKREITNSYQEMFRTATSHILIMSPYFLPGELIRKRIKQAISRGVRIQVIQAGISDILISKYAERYVYRWLFRNKVEIYEYQKSVLHGKMAVSDGEWLTVGSYNLNNLSAYASIELNLDVSDARIARDAEHKLLEIISKDCIKITEESYMKTTSMLSRVMQKGAYYLSRLLLFLFTFYFKQKE